MVFYEAKVALPAGESTATLLINGEETSLSDTVTLDHDRGCIFQTAKWRT